MRIAFDLDDTLIPSQHVFPVERPNGWLAWFMAFEPLRHGAVALLRQLQADGVEIWVYTTSMRSAWYVKRLFAWHGIRISGVVNQDRHWKHVKDLAPQVRGCEKYPPAFGIDLLIDNSEGIEFEARMMGYRMLRVRPEDEKWIEMVLEEVRGLHRLSGG
jgi:hypothetical protein